jgi:uncharacterized membrane protein YedE/YeeE
VIPALLIVGNKPFGISSNFRHLCAAVAPGRIEFFTHDWKRGAWNLAFLAGIFVGAVAAWQLAPPLTVAISPGTVAALHRLGLNDLTGLAPREVFAWSSIFTVKGFASMVVGGFLVGFGTAYASWWRRKSCRGSASRRCSGSRPSTCTGSSARRSSRPRFHC